MKALKLSVSIVNYTSGNYLVKCLESLKKNKTVDLDIWITDNASKDQSLEKARNKFPEFHYTINKDNLGFGKANNLLLKKLKTKYLLILNPDTEIGSGVLSFMLKFMEENPVVGAASCRVDLSDGSLDLASHRGFPTPLSSFRYYFLGDDSLYHLSNRSMAEVHEVDAISGAFFLTKKTVLEMVGYFDEDYFMYAEDIDLCFRIKKAGFKVMYVPYVSVIHHKGVSSGLKKHSQEITTADLETRRRSLDAFYLAMKIFYRKHYQNKYPFFINWLVYLGINTKWHLAKRKLRV